MDELDAIRARAEAATPGPWFTASKRDDYGVEYVTCVVNQEADNPYHTVAQQLAGAYGLGQICMMVDRATDADQAFIAHARTDIPALLAALDTVTAERDALAAHITALTAVSPVHDEETRAHPSGWGWMAHCPYCATVVPPETTPFPHEPDCAWALAKAARIARPPDPAEAGGAVG